MKTPNTTNWTDDQWREAAMQAPLDVLMTLRGRFVAETRAQNNTPRSSNARRKHCGLCGACDNCRTKGNIKTPEQIRQDAALSHALVEAWKTHRDKEQILALHTLHQNGMYVGNLLGITREAVRQALAKYGIKKWRKNIEAAASAA